MQENSFTTQAPEPAPHAYNDPDLSPVEFLQAVYRDPLLPMSIRIDAARGLLPYTEPRPASIPSSHIGCTIVIGGLGPCAPSPEHEPGQINEKSQSFSVGRSDNPPPQFGGPGPLNMTRNPEPSLFIDYSTPPSPQELQEIKAAINNLRPDLTHLPIPEFHLCPCGHWITGTYPCCQALTDKTKLN